MKKQSGVSRRQFLEFMGRGLAFATVMGSPFLIASRAMAGARKSRSAIDLPFAPIAPSSEDALVLAGGLNSKVLIGWDDPIGNGLRFGDCADFLHFIPKFPEKPAHEQTDGLLWVNHEDMTPLFVTGHDVSRGSPKSTQKRSRSEVIREMDSVGGSVLRIRKTKSGEWEVVHGDPATLRITARTLFPLIAPRPIAGKTVAIGTLGNCAGGATPWGTILTCEEGYEGFYGPSAKYGWETVFNYPPEHYGWVCEVDPKTGSGKKLTALGRFGHENALVIPLPDGRCAVYSGDDAPNRCLYKFIGDQPGSLETGTLYVADFEVGRWIPLVWEKNPKLRATFQDQTDLLIRCREAAELVGGTKLDRPEDIERDPATGAFFVALTNNFKANRPFGSLCRFVEADNNPESLTFTHTTYIAGGEESGLNCPDNLAFDRAGNLWVTTDVAVAGLNKAPYVKFKNNGLFVVPLKGPHAGHALQVASAPVEAEMTGPCFSPDGRTLFVSIQHPGEGTKDLAQMTSHWPRGGKSKPQSAVVAISGPLMDKIASGLLSEFQQ